MKYVISGIGGWLGHAAVHVLKHQRGVSSLDIIGIGREAGDIRIGEGDPIKVLSWAQASTMTTKSVTFLHFAFSTRDKINSLGMQEYVRSNREIIQNATGFITAVKPIRVILASSGAVYEKTGNQEFATDIVKNPYGVLKLEEELEVSQVCKSVGATCVISRVWSLSGQDLQNTKPFVLANFILDAMKYGQISIKSDFRVFRRYVDARELLLLMLTIAESKTSCNFDSGGPLVEIRDLAQEVAHQLPGEVKIVNPVLSETKSDDRYYSLSDTYEVLCQKYLGTNSLSLPQQVQNTIAGLIT